jgi:hypothetical protein
MRLVNRLARPGDICRVDLTPSAVHVQLYGGRTIDYYVASVPRGELYDNEAHSPDSPAEDRTPLQDRDGQP